MDIFAGSLPFKLKEEDLKKLFEQYGEVSSATIIIDKITRQNKGYGFVEMPNENEAQNAIQALNGSEVMGRQIIVNKSDKDKKESPKHHERKNSVKSSGYQTHNHNNNSHHSKGESNKRRQNDTRKDKGKNFRNNRRDKYSDDNQY